MSSVEQEGVVVYVFSRIGRVWCMSSVEQERVWCMSSVEGRGGVGAAPQ